MKLKRDAWGIPILDGEDIEQLSERFLRHVAPQVLGVPCFVPLAEIMERLQNDGLCTFSLNEELGSTPEGYKYLGYFHIKRKHIAIDASLLSGDPRFPFTVAHELGHFYLHGKIKPEAVKAAAPGEIRDSTRDLVTHRIEATNPRTLLEWQANRFAAGILMPRLTVRIAVARIQQSRGITRQLGTIWLDRQRASNREYQVTLTQVATTYQVSRSVARYRLRELDILHVDPITMPTRVGDTLGSALEDLFHA